MIFKASKFFLLALFASSVGVYPAFAGAQAHSDLVLAASRALDFSISICTLKISHMAVVREYALLSWVCGEGGGESLFHYQPNSWQPVTSDGGAYESRDLIEEGVPENVAIQLVQQLQAQWPSEAPSETP